MNLATIGETLKYSTMGITAGVAIGTASELVADELLSLLGVHRSEHGTSAWAEVLVRGMAAGLTFTIGNSLMGNLYSGAQDPTEGGMFVTGFIGAQPELAASIIALRSHTMRSLFSAPKDSCCGSCAQGGECDGK